MLLQRAGTHSKSQGRMDMGVRERLVVAVLQPRTDSKWSVMMGQGWDSLLSLLIQFWNSTDQVGALK